MAWPLRVLSEAECRAALADAYTLVLAFCWDGEIHAMPVNARLVGDAVWLRSAPGVKLAAARARARMAVCGFGVDELHHRGWSATARGVARVSDERPPDAPAAVRPWFEDAAEGAWIRIDVDETAGRALGPA